MLPDIFNMLSLSCHHTSCSLSSQFLMVKFLCTRQDWIAERLGVQSLTFSGYLCPGAERLGDLDDLSPEADSFNQDAVAGLFLLNKTLFFIQQLTQDMVTHQVKLNFLHVSQYHKVSSRGFTMHAASLDPRLRTNSLRKNLYGEKWKNTNLEHQLMRRRTSRLVLSVAANSEVHEEI